MKIGVRIWILIAILLLALLAISPNWKSGIQVKSVELNSTAYKEGLRSGMIIQQVDSTTIKTIEDFGNIIDQKFQNNSDFVKLTITTDKGEFILFDKEPPAITLGKVANSKLKTGLDLSGGARALVKPENVSLSESQVQELAQMMSNRLNVYGISDVNIRPVRDLGGNNYLLVEIAGATPGDIKELVGQQGKFEAKVGNISVFRGEKSDISDVCRTDAKCSGIRSCDPVQGGYQCQFSFAVYLTEAAAKRHAEVTRNLSLDSTGRYLSEKLYLFVDDKEVDSLFISADLRGQATTEISIQGPGVGQNSQEAYENAQDSMRKLQTILLTGSLPYKLEIVKLDIISPVLGQEFTRSLIILGLIVFVIVSAIIFIKYRKIKITLAVMMTMFSEAFITLGIAALINWNLDAPSIAGIIAGIGVGVNDQIVIIDESVSGKENSNIKERIKRALFIIIGAFFTIVAAMLPLFWAGAGMLRGFALTTILGVTVGILVTRPAFAEILRKIEG